MNASLKKFALAAAVAAVSVSARAGSYLIAVCPTNYGLDIGTVVLETNKGRTQATAISINDIALGSQTQVKKQKVDTLKYVAAGAGMYSIDVEALVDGRDVVNVTLELGMEPISDDEVLSGTTGLHVTYANGESEFFGSCRLSNEALLQKLAR